MTMYYHGKTMGFFNSENPGAIEANGLTLDDLTEISDEDYVNWFEPPEGKYGAWVEDKPVLLDIPAPDYVAEAEQKRDQLITEANTATYPMMLKLQMGRKLTVAETTKVNAWMDYTDALDALDLSTAPEIVWPTKPE